MTSNSSSSSETETAVSDEDLSPYKVPAVPLTGLVINSKSSIT